MNKKAQMEMFYPVGLLLGWIVIVIILGVMEFTAHIFSDMINGFITNCTGCGVALISFVKVLPFLLLFGSFIYVMMVWRAAYG